MHGMLVFPLKVLLLCHTRLNFSAPEVYYPITIIFPVINLRKHGAGEEGDGLGIDMEEGIKKVCTSTLIRFSYNEKK